VTTLVGLGSGVLAEAGERATTAELAAHLRRLGPLLEPALRGDRLVVVYGALPQLASALVRQDRAASVVPPLPLYGAVAQVQAELGTLVAAELAPFAGAPFACVVTHVRVDEDDAAFDSPSQPLGPLHDAATARALAQERGWRFAEEPGRGFRRLVPSPRPLETVELAAVLSLLDAGLGVLACGVGGIPVVSHDGRLKGVDAVVDEDRSAGLLATELEADRLVLLTDEDAVPRGFGSAHEVELRQLRPGEAEELVPELEGRRFAPTLEAAAAFVRATGGEAVITSPEALAGTLDGRTGTRISVS
jgi:carbamate kinase